MKSIFSCKWMLGLYALLTTNLLVAQTPLKDVLSPATANSLSSGSSGANAVDNSASTYVTIDNGGGIYRVDLGTARIIKGYSVSSLTSNSSYNPSNWRIEASNSATTGYVSLDARSSITWEQQGSRKFFNLNNTTAYRYYRIVNTAASRNMRLAEIELFEDFSISGKVFQDDNLNNEKESNEPAIAGAKVWLKALSSTTPVATKWTAADGTYQFTGTELDGLEIFSVTVRPTGNLQPRTEPTPQSGQSFPTLAADGNYIFSNVLSAQYDLPGIINFGFLSPTTTVASAPLLDNFNLLTNASGGSFGTTDSAGNAFLLNHPNAQYFSLTGSHPELYSNVSGYATGSNYSYQGAGYGSSGFLWDAGKYLVTDFLGTVLLETAGPNLGLKGILNNMNYGWRVTTGATTGAWNDRFLAVNGSNLQDSSMNAVLFADTVTLAAGNTYSMGFFGKSANKWQQGAQFAKPSVIKYFVKRLSTGDTAAMGSIAVQSTSGNASDSVNFGWNKAFTDFIAQYSGDYGVYFLVTSSDVSGNDAYLDNFFLRKSSYKISGKIYNDANGLTNGLVDGTLISTLSNTPLYAYLLDPADNHILGSTIVNTDGTYALFAPEFAIYNVAISTTSLINGSVFSEGLTGAWAFTGSNSGLGNILGTLLTGLNAKVAVSPVNALLDIAEVNFGFQRLPLSYNRSKNINGAPVVGTVYNLGDLPMQGSDIEDNSGTKADWNNRTLKINELPTNGFVLKYNGVALHAGDTIRNYNPALLAMQPTAATPAGTLQTSFKYATIDAARQASTDPGVHTVTFSQPLPIDLVSFTVNVNKDCEVSLNWSSAIEENFKHFAIERSANGRDFATVATVEATGSYSDYTYIDRSAGKGKQYYRLKMVDHDQSYAYSNVHSVVLNCMSAVQVFPTQTNDMLTIQGAATGSVIRVLDVSGRVLIAQPAGNGNVRLSLGHLPAAAYLIGIYNKETFDWIKVIKQ